MKQRWEDVDKYMNYQEPNRDRSTWKKSNEWAFGSQTFSYQSWPERKFDADKCPV